MSQVLDWALHTWYFIRFSQLPVRWVLWCSFCRGGKSGSESCYLLKLTPMGNGRVRIWFQPCLMPGILHYFLLPPTELLVWILVSSSVSGSSFLSVTRFYCSLNNYIENVGLASRLSLPLHYDLKFKVLCCIGSLLLEFYPTEFNLLLVLHIPSSSRVWNKAKCNECFHFENGFSLRLSLPLSHFQS